MFVSLFTIKILKGIPCKKAIFCEVSNKIYMWRSRGIRKRERETEDEEGRRGKYEKERVQLCEVVFLGFVDTAALGARTLLSMNPE